MIQIFMDGGRIVEDCPKAGFFGNAGARTERSCQFLSTILHH